MIPGLKVFFQGFACGIFTVGIVALSVRGDLTGFVVCVLLAAMFLFFGISNGERLFWRASDAGKGE